MDQPKIQVVAGGMPTGEQLAAVVVALTPTQAAPAEQRAGTEGWARAALLEGIGARPFVSASDLAGSAARS